MHPNINHITFKSLVPDDGTSRDIFCYVFLLFSLHLKENKRSFEEVVDSLRNILYCFHSSRCN